VGLPRVNPHNGPYLASADARRGQKWAVSSIDSVPLKIARRPLVVQAVGAPAPSAQRRCRVPAVECSASTIVLPAPHVARTRTCAGDLRIPLMVIHASIRLSLAAPATHLLPELLTPQAGPARSVTDTDGQIDTEGECIFPRARRRHYRRAPAGKNSPAGASAPHFPPRPVRISGVPALASLECGAILSGP
jgi:hypothetical protein